MVRGSAAEKFDIM